MNSRKIIFFYQIVGFIYYGLFLREVAAEGDALTGGGLARGPSYANGLGKAAVQEEFRKQARVFAEGGLDFFICEVTAILINLCQAIGTENSH